MPRDRSPRLWTRLQIDYVPRPSLHVESKSLKLYLMGYRNHGTFHEDGVNRVADDLFGRLSPPVPPGGLRRLQPPRRHSHKAARRQGGGPT